MEELSAEHERLRNYFLNAEQGTMNHGELEMFAKLLSVHIRKEEHAVFNVALRVLSGPELERLQARLAGHREPPHPDPGPTARKGMCS